MFGSEAVIRTDDADASFECEACQEFGVGVSRGTEDVGTAMEEDQHTSVPRFGGREPSDMDSTQGFFVERDLFQCASGDGSCIEVFTQAWIRPTR